jgi:hypothetical protein
MVPVVVIGEPETENSDGAAKLTLVTVPAGGFTQLAFAPSVPSTFVAFPDCDGRSAFNASVAVVPPVPPFATGKTPETSAVARSTASLVEPVDLNVVASMEPPAARIEAPLPTDIAALTFVPVVILPNAGLAALTVDHVGVDPGPLLVRTCVDVPGSPFRKSGLDVPDKFTPACEERTPVPVVEILPELAMSSPAALGESVEPDRCQ